jgi:hypothetical protein
MFAGVAVCMERDEVRKRLPGMMGQGPGIGHDEDFL